MIIVVNTALTLASLVFQQGGVDQDLSVTYKQVPETAAGTDMFTKVVCASICSNDLMCSGFAFFDGGKDPTKSSCKFASSISGNNYSNPGWTIVSKGRKRYRYYGCFTDEAPIRILPKLGTLSSNVTVDLCLDTCTNQGYVFAGLQLRQECWCGSTLGFRPNRSNACTSLCAGDNTRTCGGIMAAELYETGIVK